MDLVSVIIPVHNTARFIDEALGSIQAQTHRTLEILCIDDASDDGSLALLRAAAEADERIRVIALEENVGLGAARNTGLREAAGDWIYFFDSDDILVAGALEELVARAGEDRLDVLHFDAAAFADGDVPSSRLEDSRRYYRRSADYPGSWQGRELFEAMASADDWKPSMCLRFLRRSWLTEHELWSPEGVLHEDQAHAFMIAMTDSRAGYLPRALFRRRIRGGSITTSKPTAAHVLGLALACARANATADAHRVAVDSGLGRAIEREMDKTHRDAVRKYGALDPVERDRVHGASSFGLRAELELIRSQAEEGRLRAELDATVSSAQAQQRELEVELARASARIAEYGQHPARRALRRIRAGLASLRRPGER